MQTNLLLLMAAVALAGPAGAWAGTAASGGSDSAAVGNMDAHTLDRGIEHFVQSHAMPSALIGQIGRWHEAVCPAVTGLRDADDDWVSGQIVSLARSVGAPTETAGKKCHVNVEVVFTAEPQALLDHIAQKYRPLLGYYTMSEAKQFTTFSHPVQAWYETGTRSLDYQPSTSCSYQCPTPTGGIYMRAGPAPDAASEALSPFVTGLQIDSDQSSGLGSGGLGASGYSGSRLREGLRSEFVHVLIIADTKAVAKYPLHSISDYIALLALTRLASLHDCSELPSIANLFAPDCAAPPAAITPTDTAYLKALYGADLDANLNTEQGDIHQRMLHAISNK